MKSSKLRLLYLILAIGFSSFLLTKQLHTFNTYALFYDTKQTSFEMTLTFQGEDDNDNKCHGHGAKDKPNCHCEKGKKTNNPHCKDR